MLGQPEYTSAPAQRQKVPLNNIYVSVSEMQSFPALCGSSSCPAAPAQLDQCEETTSLLCLSWGPSPSPAPLFVWYVGGRVVGEHRYWLTRFNFSFHHNLNGHFPPPRIQAGHHLEAVIYVMVVLTPLRNRLLSWFIDSFFPLLIWLIS